MKRIKVIATVGQVTIRSNKATEVPINVMDIANKIQKCYAQKAMWKGYKQAEPEELVNITNVDEFVDTDYVEWISIDIDNMFVTWGQGDFTTGCNFKDLDVDTTVKLEFYDPDVAKVRIGVKPGGALVVIDDEIVAIHKVADNGFIGDFKWERVSECRLTGHGTEYIEPIVRFNYMD